MGLFERHRLTPIERWILGSVGAGVALIAVGALTLWLWQPPLEQWGGIALEVWVAYRWGECVGTCRAELLEDERKYGPWLWLTDPVVNEKGFVQQTDLFSGAGIETNPNELTFAEALNVGGCRARVIPGRRDLLSHTARCAKLDDPPCTQAVDKAEARNVADLQLQSLETAHRDLASGPGGVDGR